MTTTPTLSRGGRTLCIGLGLLCVGLGTVGIFVPGLPTTVFLLAASWLFARSSPRLRDRLHRDPRLGGFLRRAREGRIPLRARLLSIAAIWAGIAVALAGPAGTVLPLVALLVGSGLAGTAAVALVGASRFLPPRGSGYRIMAAPRR